MHPWQRPKRNPDAPTSPETLARLRDLAASGSTRGEYNVFTSVGVQPWELADLLNAYDAERQRADLAEERLHRVVEAQRENLSDLNALSQTLLGRRDGTRREMVTAAAALAYRLAKEKRRAERLEAALRHVGKCEFCYGKGHRITSVDRDQEYDSVCKYCRGSGLVAAAREALDNAGEASPERGGNFWTPIFRLGSDSRPRAVANLPPENAHVVLKGEDGEYYAGEYEAGSVYVGDLSYPLGFFDAFHVLPEEAK